VAIKVLDKKFMDADEIKSLHHEIQIMEMIDHPNIVKYLEAYDDKRFLYIVMQKCEQGCLFDSRQTNLKEGRSFTEQQSADIIEKLLKALNHCHQLNVVHRDIKPENIMFDSFGEPRLVDFGLAI
jgi:serine/threonine protein kinase